MVRKSCVNVNLLLSTPWRHTGRVNIYPHSLLTSKADRSEWLTLHSCWFTLQDRPSVPYPLESGLTPEPVWRFLRREELFAPTWTRTLNCPAHIRVTILTTLPWLQVSFSCSHFVCITCYMSIIRDAVSVSGIWYRKCIASLVLLMLLAKICCNIILQL